MPGKFNAFLSKARDTAVSVGSQAGTAIRVSLNALDMVVSEAYFYLAIRTLQILLHQRRNRLLETFRSLSKPKPNEQNTSFMRFSPHLRIHTSARSQ
jgi:hypothetical protein